MFKTDYKLIFVLALLMVFLTSISMGVIQVVDNLDNDSAVTDQAGSADASWFQQDPASPNSNAIYTLSADTATFQSTPASARIDWNKPGTGWDHFRITRLDRAGNTGDFSGYDGIRIDIYGEAPNTLVKLFDTDGDESGDIGIKDHTGTSWDTVEWPFANLNSCDLNKITEILIFVSAGQAGSGVCYFDNVRLYKTGEELTIDNFDNDSSIEDETSNADSKVTVNSQVETIQVTVDTADPYSAPACAKAVYANKPEWGLFFISGLNSGDSNITDFSKVDTLKLAVKTDLSGQMLIKLKDADGIETGDLGFVTPQVGQWDVVEWPIKTNSNLGSCDLTRIEAIIVFPPVAGTSGTGTVYFDDLVIDAPVPPGPGTSASTWELYE
jgi:hypothetical protein